MFNLLYPNINSKYDIISNFIIKILHYNAIGKNKGNFLTFKLCDKSKDRNKVNYFSSIGYILNYFTSLVSVLKMPSYFASSVSIECHNVQKEFHYFRILPVIVTTITLYRYNVFTTSISSLSLSLLLSLNMLNYD